MPEMPVTSFADLPHTSQESADVRNLPRSTRVFAFLGHPFGEMFHRRWPSVYHSLRCIFAPNDFQMTHTFLLLARVFEVHTSQKLQNP